MSTHPCLFAAIFALLLVLLPTFRFVLTGHHLDDFDIWTNNKSYTIKLERVLNYHCPLPLCIRTEPLSSLLIFRDLTGNRWWRPFHGIVESPFSFEPTTFACILKFENSSSFNTWNDNVLSFPQKDNSFSSWVTSSPLSFESCLLITHSLNTHLPPLRHL